jgi:hypothetical protein
MHRFLAVSIALFLGACASTPNVSYSYFLPTSDTTVSVTQTIDCTADKTALAISYSAPLVTTVNIADTSRGPFALPVKKLDSALADSDFSVTLTDDGRLKGINASWTGQGETVLTSAISLGKTLAALGAEGPQVPRPLPECTFLKNWGGGKPLSLVYSGLINLGAGDAFDLDLRPAQDETSQKIYEGLNESGRVPDVRLIVISRTEIPNVASYAGAPGDYDVWLTLTRMENVKFDVETGGKTIFSSSVVVPGTNTYQLPVPGAALFGKQSFALTLTDMGAISSIDYGKLTGAASPFNIVGSIVSPVTPP